MELEFDEEKRRLTLINRGLDFDHANHLFEGCHFTSEDNRFDYGETRYISIGMIGADVVVVVWTERQKRRRIISMRKANSDERGEYHDALE